MAYEAIRISESAYRIENDMVRAFLFTGTEKALLIDTGFGGEGDISQVVSGLTDLPVVLVNTHADDDHTGGNEHFEKAYLHPSEFSYYKKSSAGKAQPIPIWEGDIIDLGDRSFEVILLPGHTPGSIGLLDRANKILVGGDSVTVSPVFMFGGIRDISAFIASMDKLLALRDVIGTVYPSHGPFPITPDQIGKLKDCALAILDGKVEGQAPPFEMPALMYEYNGAAFFYAK
jgi:glyoxylase-like metal-dependent hydrolase (beta-lactamase superfamily II)